MTNTIFASQLGFLKMVMQMNASDITHEESLVSSPQSGNSVNWLIGHMLVVRDNMLKAMDLPSLTNEEMEKLYNRGTQNITKETGMPLEELISLYYKGTDEMLKRLQGEEITDAEKINMIAPLIFHESYHSGQIGLFRRLIGKEPKIK